jgi:hypothetical protein
MKDFLVENKRISVESLRSLDYDLLSALANALCSRKVKICASYVRELKGGQSLRG